MQRSLLIGLTLFPFLSWAQAARVERSVLVQDSLKNVLVSPKTLTKIERINTLNELAHYLRVSFPDSAMAYAQEALNLSKKEQYKIGECDAKITLGLIYWLRAKYDLGLECCMTALQISDSIGYRKGMMESNLLFGSVYNEIRDFKKAEAYSRRALTLALELQHAQGIARACNAIGNHCRRRKEGKEAMRYYQMGVSFLEGKKDNSIKNVLLNNMALYYIERGEEKEKIQAYLNEALQIAEDFKNRSAELLTRMRFGAFYNSTKEFYKAEEHFKISEKICNDLGYGNALLDVYTNMIRLKTKTGRDAEARDYVAKYTVLKDSLFSFERARRIAELETRNETEKREQTIKLLEKEKQIETTWRNSLIGGVLLTTISGFFIYRLQRSRTRKAKQLLEVQQLLNDKLKEINNFNSRFYANVSHEFRTPLSLILAPLEEVQKNESLSTRENELLSLTSRNARRLLDLVNQLLDLSKLEAGKMELKVKSGNLEAFLHVIASSFDSIAESRQIGFKKNIAAGSHALWFDPDKLEKIITNLLANAFKFTPTHGVVTFAVFLNEADENGTLTIVITDTGRGIPKDEQAFVFLPFYQTKQTSGGVNTGTGIGLSLVNELIKLYRGSISFQSYPDRGTEFTITLPTSKRAFSQDQILESLQEDSFLPAMGVGFAEGPLNEDIFSDDDAPTTNEKDTVLIVEDNAELLNFLASKLRNSFTVLTATDGEEALRLALKAVPNLVLSDLMMPQLDGIQLTDKLKTDIRTSHIPIVLLTAKNEQETRIDGLKTGADDYLTKPFSTEELLVRITNLITQRKKLADRFHERILAGASPFSEPSLDDKFLRKVKEVVEEHISDFTFSVERLAEETNLSRAQLLRKLKALTGLAPNEFIKDLRLKRAADMILQKVDTVTQIGYAVGFNDQSYFTKCFKKQYGVTPKDYTGQPDDRLKNTESY